MLAANPASQDCPTLGPPLKKEVNMVSRFTCSDHCSSLVTAGEAAVNECCSITTSCCHLLPKSLTAHFNLEVFSCQRTWKNIPGHVTQVPLNIGRCSWRLFNATDWTEKITLVLRK